MTNTLTDRTVALWTLYDRDDRAVLTGTYSDCVTRWEAESGPADWMLRIALGR